MEASERYNERLRWLMNQWSVFVGDEKEERIRDVAMATVHDALNSFLRLDETPTAYAERRLDEAWHMPTDILLVTDKRIIRAQLAPFAEAEGLQGAKIDWQAVPRVVGFDGLQITATSRLDYPYSPAEPIRLQEPMSAAVLLPEALRWQGEGGWWEWEPMPRARFGRWIEAWDALVFR